MATLRDMAREVQLYNQDVPILLAERWINNRYLRLCERFMWSFKVGEGQFTTTASYADGTIDLTNADETVSGNSTTFTSAMAGRQLRTNNYVFTIATYTSGTALELDRTWGDATASAQTYSIVTAYITPAESDFQSFISVINPTDGAPLSMGYSTRELDRRDPQRSQTGQPRAIVARVYNSAGTLPMYELYPHPTALQTFPYLYEKRIARLTSSDTPPPIIRSDILIAGALADMARWPGTVEKPNPMADPNRLNWRAYETEYKELMDRAMLEDENIYLNNFVRRFPGVAAIPGGTDFYRSHDF